MRHVLEQLDRFQLYINSIIYQAQIFTIIHTTMLKKCHGSTPIKSRHEQVISRNFSPMNGVFLPKLLRPISGPGQPQFDLKKKPLQEQLRLKKERKKNRRQLKKPTVKIFAEHKKIPASMPAMMTTTTTATMMTTQVSRQYASA